MRCFHSLLARPQDTLSFSLILAASVMSLKTAVNEKIPIKDQDYEAQLASSKFGITKDF